MDMQHLIILSVILLCCLAGTPVKAEQGEEDKEPSYLFYPALPNPPYIQYLKRFSTSKDLEVKKEESFFTKFILGDEQETDAEGVNKPYGVALFEGKVYVVDIRGGGYAIFDLKDKKYSFILGVGSSVMPKPINITIDTDGTKYITDTVRKQVLVFDRDDKFLEAYGNEGQFSPADVAIAGDKLFVANIQDHNIQVLDKASGNLLQTFSEAGSEEGQLFHPTNLAIGPDNYLYVSDTANSRIQKFTLDGEFVKSFGTRGSSAGEFARPKGIALDHDGNIFAVDAAFENVQIFDSEGKLLLFFGGPARNHPSGMDLPTDIYINYESVEYFQQYADPKFKLQYIILVANQFGPSKVNVFGFGRMEGMSYLENE